MAGQLPTRSAQKIVKGAADKLSVTWQNPPAGTPVTPGTLVEVRTACASDVVYGQLDADIPTGIAGIPVAKVLEVLEGDPRLRVLVEQGKPSSAPTGTGDAAGYIREAFQKKGITVNPSMGDTIVILKSLHENLT